MLQSIAKLHSIEKVKTNTHCIIAIAFISCRNGQNIHRRMNTMQLIQCQKGRKEESIAKHIRLTM